jgi:alpha-methylacyl-CoA racemase
MTGPLSQVRVIELAGLGPAPFCGMVLADLGAEVIRIDRADGVVGEHTSRTKYDLHNRGKRSIGINLKTPGAVEVALDLVETAEILIEGFRPGVMERLGIGPAECLARNAALVYGRVTGWGQKGLFASTAGHDIGYIALSGVLHAVGPAERPIPPLNLIGDYGGGGMLLGLGVVAALLSARATGEGQIVDAAMVDGSALLMASHHGLVAEGVWTASTRESNLLDGGAPFYAIYETSDGRFMAVGALEPQFYAELIDGLALEPGDLPAQTDRAGWPVLREVFTARFLEKTREEWADHFEGTDACVAPVLSMEEAPNHPHHRSRGAFVEVDDVTQPAPAPRFSTTMPTVSSGPSIPGADTDSILDQLGYNSSQIGMLRSSGAVA